MGDQPLERPLPAHRTTQTQNKCTQTSMPRVGFELMIPVCERAETVNALDRAATVIGSLCNYCILEFQNRLWIINNTCTAVC
jgi:hypothetical protein